MYAVVAERRDWSKEIAALAEEEATARQWGTAIASDLLSPGSPYIRVCVRPVSLAPVEIAGIVADIARRDALAGTPNQSEGRFPSQWESVYLDAFRHARQGP
jgi:hypothetical protein